MKKTIIFLIIISYLVRLLISPFLVVFPMLPHDYYAHSGAGEAMMEGNFFMETSKRFQPEPGPMVYGPFFTILVTLWYLLFGVFDWYMFKLPVIIFDALNTVMIYLIGKKILKERLAFYVSLLYCFSFISLLNSAVLGDDMIYSLFFFLCSVYFLIHDKPLISAVFFSITEMFRFAPWALYLFALCCYVFRKWELKGLLKYILVTGVSFVVMLLPFVVLVGWYKATYYILGGPTGLQEKIGFYSSFLSFYNIFRLITGININFLLIPIFFVIYVITSCIIFERNSKNKEMDLFKNITLIGIVGLLFGPILAGQYMNWIIVPLFILFGTKLKSYHITKQWIFGVILIIISLLIYSIIYRGNFNIQYSRLDRVLLLSAIILAPFGVFNLLHHVDNRYRLIWVFIVFAVIMSFEYEAGPLLAFPIKDISQRLINLNYFKTINKEFGNHIGGRTDFFLAYGSFSFFSAVIMWFCLGFLYYSLLFVRFKENDKR